MQIQKKKDDQNNQKNAQAVQPAVNSNSIYNLLSNLKPSDEEQKLSNQDSHSEDEDAAKLVDRKISLNRTNVIGLNLE